MSLLRKGKLAPKSDRVAEFTSSIKSDACLTEAVIRINKAHAVMLARRKLISKREAGLILKALAELNPKMPLDQDLEDVHMNVEAEVTRKVGEEIGGKMHLAKSRNDQVSAALRMVLRDYALAIIETLNGLQGALLEVARGHVSDVMPGYTHMQQAQPVTVAGYLLSYYDLLERGKNRLMGSYGRINSSPMGACAIAGTGFPIDRGLVAELLGFETVIENSMDATGSRDFLTETLADLSLLMTDLSRLSGDLILWSTSEFGFISLPDEFVSTSSIMPQKRNPEILEVIRARSAHVCGNFQAALMITQRTSAGYSLDLQELNPLVWDSCEKTHSSISMLAELLPAIKFNEGAMKRAMSGFITSTDLADALVRRANLPFRKAYHVVNAAIKKLLEEDKSLKDLDIGTLKHLTRKVGEAELKMSKEELRKTLDPEESVKFRSGMAPKEVTAILDSRKKELSAGIAWHDANLKFIEDAYGKLEAAANKLSGC